jgi:hypothetical protein
MRAVVYLLKKKYGRSDVDAINDRIHCMAHVVNLVVQDILCELGEAAVSAQDDYFEHHKSDPVHLSEEDAEFIYNGKGDDDNEADVIDIDAEEVEEDEGDSDNEDDGGTISDEELLELIREAESHEAEAAARAVKKASPLKKVR